jgi:hypothetical protein
MEFQKVLVTPEMANGYLSKNKGNRRPKMPTVLRYSNEMKAGKWKENTGELIKISKQGNVLDGQHRLMAVVHSKESIYFHFAFDVEENVFDVLDTGSTRNASDSFHIKGVKNANAVPAMITLGYALKQGLSYVKNSQKHQRLSNADLLIQYLDNSEYWDEVATNAITWYHNFAKILAPSTIGGIYSVLKDVDEEISFNFMKELCTGVDVTNNTIYLLRNALMKDKVSNRRMKMDMKLALILKTWNFYKSNKSTKVLLWNPLVEKFPQF